MPPGPKNEGRKRDEKMADEPIINDSVEEVVPDQSQPPVETQETPEPPVEQLPEEQEEQPQEVDTQEVPEERPPSRREQKRVRDLLQKYPDLEERPQPPSQSKDRLDYNDLDAEPEVVKALEDDRRRAEEAQYKAGLEQTNSIQFHTRLELDAPKVESKYPQLNPESSDFDPEAADDINSLYLHVVGYNPQTGRVQNPNLRYADFVDVQVELAKRLASKQTVESTKNIVKQNAQTSLRPDGSSAKGLDLSKDPKDMSTDELYAVIGGERPPK